MSSDLVNSKILLIDDDLANRILIAEILEGAKVVIIECGCGREAFGLFKKHCVDIKLVLLDIDLPRCNGWDLGKLFREMKPEVVIIAVSAIPLDELTAGCLEGEFDGFISKPFDIDNFLEMVTAYLH